MKDALIVFCTCPDMGSAQRISESLVDRDLAACVNISSPVTSVYKWQGKLETAEEILLLIKTNSSRYEALQQSLVDLHPYELPEVVAVPVSQGLPGYLDWINQCTKTEFPTPPG
ncbi:MAG: divalent-cation tolerance protein CutA [Gammaproteobacteria bacterium]|nr:divalent-cation tolerance protein CutA [Gammaproteobacteria bacterium]